MSASPEYQAMFGDLISPEQIENFRKMLDIIDDNDTALSSFFRDIGGMSLRHNIAGTKYFLRISIIVHKFLQINVLDSSNDNIICKDFNCELIIDGEVNVLYDQETQMYRSRSELPANAHLAYLVLDVCEEVQKKVREAEEAN